MKKQIMAILNVTPNSYYDGGRYFDLDKAVQKGIELKEQGANILDVGGCSTKPFSVPPPVEEEIRRTAYVIKKLSQKVTIPISIDSYRPEVIEVALNEGATFINDVTGFEDPIVRKLAKESNASICIMHMQNNSQTMQINPHYEKGVVEEIYEYLDKQIQICLGEGIKADKISIDPGIGFGKSLDDNFTILQNLNKFRGLDFPILLGLSRKSPIFKTLKVTPQDCLAATIALNSAIYPNVDIFRVHDVKEHRHMVEILKKFNCELNPMDADARDSSSLYTHH